MRALATVALVLLAGALSLASVGFELPGDNPSGLPQCVYHENTWCESCTGKQSAEQCVHASNMDDEPCNVCPGTQVCARGALTGNASRSGSTAYFTDGTICSRPCDQDSDCSDLNWAAANADYSVASETWTCQDLADGRLCTVEVQAGGSGQTPCQQCLEACRGLSGCCTGVGCICESDC